MATVVIICFKMMLEKNAAVTMEPWCIVLISTVAAMLTLQLVAQPGIYVQEQPA